MAEPQELPEAGYQDLRNYIVNAWTYVQIENDAGDPLMRIPTTDPRTRWTNNPGDSTLELAITLTGSDRELINLYKPGGFVIGASTLHKSIDETHARSRATYSELIIEEPEDTVLLRHRVVVPEVR